MRLSTLSARKQFILALLLSSLISELLFVYRAFHHRSLYFDYLSWNLLLAWVPFILALYISKVLTRKRWSSWEALILTILWLIFLPNSFYMISDFVHLEYLNQSSIIYDTLMLTSFIYNGVVLGFASLYLIHLQLKKRLSRVPATSLIALTLFISSVAVYFGRNLRLSSFNVFTNPGGLLFNITNSVFHIHSYPDLFTLVITTFLLLCSMYIVFWQGIKVLSKAENR